MATAHARTGACEQARAAARSRPRAPADAAAGRSPTRSPTRSARPRTPRPAAPSTRSCSGSPIFVLAIFVGYYVVWSVTPALHTPLMSVTNAISSVIVVGALLAVGVAADRLRHRAARAPSASSRLILAAVNIFGGFLVTQRMLACTSKKG